METETLDQWLFEVVEAEIETCHEIMVSNRALQKTLEDLQSQCAALEQDNEELQRQIRRAWQQLQAEAIRLSERLHKGRETAAQTALYPPTGPQ